MKTLAIIQARMGSSRFPGKSLAKIGGQTILDLMMAQLAHCRFLDSVVLAIPDTPVDDILAQHATLKGWHLYRGDEDDVLGRFYEAAVAHGIDQSDGVVRLTGDDIFPDPNLIDALALCFRSFGGRYDYIATNKSGELPYGAGVELVSFKALKEAHIEATSKKDREHVVPFIKWNSDRFPCLELKSSQDWSGKLSLSIDTVEDLERNRRLLQQLQTRGRPPYLIDDILSAAELITE